METIMRDFPRATLPRSLAGETLPRRLGGTLQRLWLAYMDWRLQRLAVSLLSRMSDRQLKDMGLTRGQIEFAVRDQDGQQAILNGRFS
jgi:uncharacterized protein YjiS (DUF1127 family)